MPKVVTERVRIKGGQKLDLVGQIQIFGHRSNIMYSLCPVSSPLDDVDLVIAYFFPHQTIFYWKMKVNLNRLSYGSLSGYQG